MKPARGRGRIPCEFYGVGALRVGNTLTIRIARPPARVFTEAERRRTERVSSLGKSNLGGEPRRTIVHVDIPRDADVTLRLSNGARNVRERVRYALS